MSKETQRDLLEETTEEKIQRYNKQLQQDIKDDVLYYQKEDRRILSHVPIDFRKESDRRGFETLKMSRKNRRKSSFLKFFSNKDDYTKKTDNLNAGIRYRVDFPVKTDNNKAKIVDISMTGCLIKSDTPIDKLSYLTFEITPGSMPEGLEMEVNKIKSKIVRSFKKNNKYYYGVQFEKSLRNYSFHKKEIKDFIVSVILLAIIVGIIALMRSESAIYFKFNHWLYLYSIITATFLLSRYIFSMFYRPVDVDEDFTPSVSIIIPCFNEEQWITKTIHSCINQDYPLDKLEVIIVDDKSTDNSLQVCKDYVQEIYDSDYKGIYKTRERIYILEQPVNKGKREAMGLGVRHAKGEICVFVDSDSFVDPFAIRHLVQPFKDEKVGAVSGRTDVYNAYTNLLTMMQSARYYISFRVMKAAESVLNCVSCCSGPLSAYRKDIILEVLEPWLKQSFLGYRATFGDDRSLTNFVLRNYRTTYQDTAIVNTIAPNTYKMFFKQQMRWKRSWLRESFIALTFMPKKEILAFIFFLFGLIVPLLAPIIVIYNMICIPVMYKTWPITFLIGIFLMAAIFSTVQLLLRHSKTFLGGFYFCFLYSSVMLWQLPYSWFTWYVSSWGTRMTSDDVQAAIEQEEKQKK